MSDLVGAGTRIGFAVAIALVACGGDDGFHVVPEIKLTPAQEQDIAATIKQSRARIAELDKPWRAAITAVDPYVVRDGKCHELEWAIAGLRGNPQTRDWGSWDVLPPLAFVGGASASFSHAPFPITFLKVGEPIPDSSPHAAAEFTNFKSLEKGRWRTKTFEERKQLATHETLSSVDVLVRFDRFIEPKLKEHDIFTPGELEVSAWAFDHDKNAVVCAGVFTAKSSPTVNWHYTNFNDDLMINLMRALPGGIHATK